MTARRGATDAQPASPSGARNAGAATSPASGLRAEDYATRDDVIEGWPVRLIAYRIGAEYFASVESVDPGATIARARASSGEEALRRACEKATERLARTQRR